MILIIIIGFLFWFSFALIVSFVAKSRGHSAILFFFICVFLSSIIGLILALLLPPSQLRGNAQSLSMAGELQLLKRLTDEGVITQEEFQAQKARLISNSESNESIISKKSIPDFRDASRDVSNKSRIVGIKADFLLTFVYFVVMSIPASSLLNYLGANLFYNPLNLYFAPTHWLFINILKSPNNLIFLFSYLFVSFICIYIALNYFSEKFISLIVSGFCITFLFLLPSFVGYYRYIGSIEFFYYFPSAWMSLLLGGVLSVAILYLSVKLARVMVASARPVSAI